VTEKKDIVLDFLGGVATCCAEPAHKNTRVRFVAKSRTKQNGDLAIIVRGGHA